MTGAERVEAILAEQRCRDVHAERWRGAKGVHRVCESCTGWGKHVAVLVAAETGGLAEVIEEFRELALMHSGEADEYTAGHTSSYPMGLSRGRAIGYGACVERLTRFLAQPALVPDQQTSEGSEREIAPEYMAGLNALRDKAAWDALNDAADALHDENLREYIAENFTDPRPSPSDAAPEGGGTDG